jgi:hypothetical protein
MTFVLVTSITLTAPRPPRRTPGYELRLECGHVIRRGFSGGPIPKRVRCPECAAG